MLRARAALQRGDFDEVSTFLDEASGLTAEIRAHAVAALPGIDAPLSRWGQERPDDPHFHLLAAVRRLDAVPWLSAELEGRSPAHQHADEVESLWRAVDHLQEAFRRGPRDVAPTIWLAAVVGALVWRGAAPIQDFEVCAKEAEELEPAALQIRRWRVHLTEVVPDADGVELAAQWSADLPPGDPRHAEVVTAHIAKYRVLEENEQAGAQYWQREDVTAAVIAANERLGVPNGPAAHDASAVMAFALPRTRQPRLALPHFDRLDGRVLTWPFAMMRNPLGAFSELQQAARTRSIKNLLRRR